MSKPIVAILCIVSFLNVSFASVSRAADAATWEMWPRTKTEAGNQQGPAAETIELANDWETWPRKKLEPGVAPKPATEAAAVEAADDSKGRKASKRSYGKIVWIVLGIAAAVGIGIAAGSGGGGDNGGTVVNPGHK